jgi:glycosyltransferase involved in cell wall biosynthesis
MYKPLISILTLTFEQKSFVEEALNSLQVQSYQNWEAIVVDDCSRDGTREYLQNSEFNSDDRFQMVYNETNLGIGKSLNTALRTSKGDYVCILACDDVLLPNKLKVQIEAIRGSKNNVKLLYSDAYILEENSKTDELFINSIGKKTFNPEGDVYDELLKQNFIPTPTVMIKKDVLVDAGGFSEDLFIEDYDLWLRIAQKHPFSFDANIEVNYRLHANNNIKKVKNWLLYRINCYSKLSRISKQFVKSLNHSFYHYYIAEPKKCRDILDQHPHNQHVYPLVKRMISKQKSPKYKGQLLKLISLLKN